MTFERLSKMMMSELGTNKLSDIAMELGVSPQVVSAWKSRNQVPYKYVKMLRSKLKGAKNNDLNTSNYKNPTADFFVSDANDTDEDILKVILPLLKLCVDNYKKIILITLLFCVSSYGYVKYLKIPVYTSVSKIVPISMVSQKSGINSIASSFGIELGGNNFSSGLTSAEMFPALITSRSLMGSLLDVNFDTKAHGNSQPLIKIILNSKNDKKNWSYSQRKKAVDKLLRMVGVTKKRKSPLLTLTCSTTEPQFSAALLKSVIDKLVIKARNHKIESVKQTIKFIKSRLKDVKKELLAKEDALKVFTESNRLIESSPTLVLERQRMSRDLEVTSSLYGSLLREYESVKIEESKLETYFEILDPPEIPSRPSNISITKTVLKLTLLGFVISLIVVFSIDFYSKKKQDLKILYK